MLRIIVICVLVIIFWKLLVVLGVIGLVGTGFLAAFLLENLHFLMIWGLINYFLFTYFLKDLMNDPDARLLNHLSTKIPYRSLLAIVSALTFIGGFILMNNLFNSVFQSMLMFGTFAVTALGFFGIGFKLSPINSIIWMATSIAAFGFIGILNLSTFLSIAIGIIYCIISIVVADHFYVEKIPVDETPVDPLQNIHRYQPPENIKSESGMYCYHCGKKMGIDSLKYAEKRYCTACEKLDLPKVVEKVAEVIQPTVNQLNSSQVKKSINMNLIIGIFVSIILVLILFQLLSGSKNDTKTSDRVTSSFSNHQVKIYEYDKKIQLTGTLVSQKNNDIENPFTFIAIRLDQPISLKANGESEAESNIVIMQLAFDDVVRSKVVKNLNKKIKINGTLFHSFSAHHATKVLVSVDSIDVFLN